MQINKECSCLAVFLCAACISPGRSNGTTSSERLSLLGSLNPPQSTGRERKSVPSVQEASDDNSLSRVGRNVWRSSLPASTAFQLMVRMLSQNYVLAQSDRKQLTITTEWDKFFIDGRLFRNRISASVFPISSQSTEIVFNNTVEYHTGGKENQGIINDSQWLPTQDVTDEVPRLVDSLARQSAEWARSNENKRR